MITILKSLNLALAFLLELCLLAALGYWGFRVGSGWIARIALGVGAPAVVIAIWGIFLAPTSSHDCTSRGSCWRRSCFSAPRPLPCMPQGAPSSPGYWWCCS